MFRMIVKAMKCCLAATLLSIIWKRVHGDHNKRYKHNGSASCGYSHYFDGKDCAECPPGTYGLNCSYKCLPLTYGRLCSKTCNCSNSPCHHIHGCTGISSALDKTTTTLTVINITDSTDFNCSFNNYFNGNYCAECPTGYIGINCSTKCAPSTYGKLCSQKCVCSNSSCHHVFGCSVISTVLARRTTIVDTFTGTINTTPDIKAERDIDKKDIRATTGYVFISEHLEKILVILAGTVSSLILLLLIAREIYKLFRMSETCSNYQLTTVSPVINNTSDYTTEFLDNSYEHRDI